MDQTVKRKMHRTIIGFVPGESIMYKLHPVVRLSLYIATGILPLFIETPEISMLFIAIVLILFVIANVNLNRLKIFTPMLITVGIIINLTYIFFPIRREEGLVMFSLLGLDVNFYSTMWAFAIYLRIITLVLSSVFYFSTNRERDILVAMRTIGTPFVVSYFIGLALRSAGIFLEDYSIIREAEQARGLDVRNLSFLGKVKHFSMYLVPLFTLSIRKSDDISTGLFAKGTELTGKIDGVKRADYLRSKLKITKIDKTWLVAIILFTVTVIVVSVTTGLLTIEGSWIFQSIEKYFFG